MKAALPAPAMRAVFYGMDVMDCRDRLPRLPWRVDVLDYTADSPRWEYVGKYLAPPGVVDFMRKVVGPDFSRHIEIGEWSYYLSRRDRLRRVRTVDFASDHPNVTTADPTLEAFA